MSDLMLACDCGAVRGVLADASPANTIRLACYCDDCQAFARGLGRADVLDAWGGSDIVQTTPGRVAITSGAEHLQSLRLTPKGILRWYAGCCRTPLANTVSAKLPFVALIRPFVRDDETDRVLGPVRYRIFGRFATNPPADLALHPKAPLAMLLKVGPRIFAAKLRGEGAGNAFFAADGAPTVAPRVGTPDA